MTPGEIDKWGSAFVELFRDGPESDPSHPLAWAHQEFISCVFDEPERCWQAVLCAMARSPSSHAIGMLAAGPIEDIIALHGAAFIDRIEHQARIDPRFREALGGVWNCDAPEAVWRRVCAARSES